MNGFGINRRFSGLSRRIGSRFDISGGRQVLPFSDLTFARNGEEYIRFGSTLTKQATSNVPATRTIGGRVFMQSGPAFVTINTYSEEHETGTSNWVEDRVTVTDNSIVSPSGDTTAGTMIETSDTGTHRVWQQVSTDAISQYFYSDFVQSNGRTKCQLVLGGPAFDAQNAYFNLSTIQVYNITGCDFYGIIQLSDEWFYRYIAITSDAIGIGYIYAQLVDDLDQVSYAGDVSKGINIVGSNIVKSTVIPPYIYADSSPGAQPKTEGYWAEAVVNTKPWVRQRFYFEIYTNHYTSAILASDGGEKHLWSFDATAGAIRCYLDGADSNKMKIDLVGTGNIISSAALTPTLDGRIRCWFTFDNGSNSVLRVVGAGVDAEYTGVQLAASDGNLHWGQREDATLQPSCLISPPEKF